MGELQKSYGASLESPTAERRRERHRTCSSFVSCSSSDDGRDICMTTETASECIPHVAETKHVRADAEGTPSEGHSASKFDDESSMRDVAPKLCASRAVESQEASVALPTATCPFGDTCLEQVEVDPALPAKTVEPLPFATNSRSILPSTTLFSDVPRLQAESVTTEFKDGFIFVKARVGESFLVIQTKAVEVTSIAKAPAGAVMASMPTYRPAVADSLISIMCRTSENILDIKACVVQTFISQNEENLDLAISTGKIKENVASAYQFAQDGVSTATVGAKSLAADATVQTTAVTTAGAVGGAAVGGTTGGALGLFAGAVGGLPAALFTCGLSVPVGAVCGAGIGTAAGGTVGAVSGGAAGYVASTHKAEIKNVANTAAAKIGAGSDYVTGTALSSMRLLRSRLGSS